RDGKYIDCAGQSFRDFLKGKLAALPGELPTMDDWELHMTTVYPEVRLKRYMEMRGADAGGKPWICALPALWKGLLYDQKALDKVHAMVADWTHAEVLGMRAAVPERGLKTRFRETTLLQLAEDVVDIARAGLEHSRQLNAAGQDETIHLAPVIRAVDNNWTQAEAWLEAYHKDWDGRIEPIFQFAALP
ncbi:MAG: glutamate--cysteine ligase, partial [Zetaproteobacteria bacterium CG_4_8_14_3_um_filter_59_5]